MLELYLAEGDNGLLRDLEEFAQAGDTPEAAALGAYELATLLEQSAGRAHDVARLYLHSVTQWPSFAPALQGLRAHWIRREQWQEASDALAQLAAAADREQGPRLLIERALLLRGRLAQPDLAREQLHAATRHETTTSGAWRLLYVEACEQRNAKSLQRITRMLASLEQGALARSMAVEAMLRTDSHEERSALWQRIDRCQHMLVLDAWQLKAAQIQQPDELVEILTERTRLLISQEASPTAVAALLARRANLALRAGDIATARRHLTSALTRLPNEPFLTREMGRILSAEGRYADVAHLLAERHGASTDGQRNVLYALRRIESLLLAGQADEAAFALGGQRSGSDARHAHIGHALRLSHAMINAPSELATVLDALAESCISQQPLTAADLWVVAAGCSQNPLRSATLLRRALDVAPTHRDARTALVDLLVGLGDWRGAYGAIATGALPPAEATAVLRLGALALLADEPELALSAHQQLVVLRGDDWASRWVALGLERLGRAEEWEQHIGAWADIARGPVRANLLFLLADAAFRSGQETLAAKRLNAILEEFPEMDIARDAALHLARRREDHRLAYQLLIEGANQADSPRADTWRDELLVRAFGSEAHCGDAIVVARQLLDVDASHELAHLALALLAPPGDNAETHWSALAPCVSAEYEAALASLAHADEEAAAGRLIRLANDDNAIGVAAAAALWCLAVARKNRSWERLALLRLARTNGAALRGPAVELLAWLTWQAGETNAPASDADASMGSLLLMCARHEVAQEWAEAAQGWGRLARRGATMAFALRAAMAHASLGAHRECLDELKLAAERGASRSALARIALHLTAPSSAECLREVASWLDVPDVTAQVRRTWFVAMAGDRDAVVPLLTLLATRWPTDLNVLWTQLEIGIWAGTDALALSAADLLCRRFPDRAFDIQRRLLPIYVGPGPGANPTLAGRLGDSLLLGEPTDEELHLLAMAARAQNHADRLAAIMARRVARARARAPKELGDALFESAAAAVLRGDVAEAADFLDEALSIGATPGALRMRGDVAFVMGKLDHALECWELALVQLHGSEQHELVGKIADVLAARESPQSALIFLHAQLRRHPHEALWEHVVRIGRRAQQWQEVDVALRELATLRSGERLIQVELARAHVLADKRGELEAARQLICAALMREPFSIELAKAAWMLPGADHLSLYREWMGSLRDAAERSPATKEMADFLLALASWREDTVLMSLAAIAASGTDLPSDRVPQTSLDWEILPSLATDVALWGREAELLERWHPWGILLNRLEGTLHPLANATVDTRSKSHLAVERLATLTNTQMLRRPWAELERSVGALHLACGQPWSAPVAPSDVAAVKKRLQRADGKLGRASRPMTATELAALARAATLASARVDVLSRGNIEPLGEQGQAINGLFGWLCSESTAEFVKRGARG